MPDIPSVAPEIDLVTDRESSLVAELTVNDPPTPTLPDVVRVLKVVFPETERVELPNDPNIPADVTLSEAPIPTLPVRSENPLTLSPPLANVNPVVVKLAPIPALPVTDSDDPIPTKPDRNVVPVFCRLYVGADVPIPNLKLLLSK